MNLRTLFAFLFTGSPTAIAKIAASRSSLWIGLAFVLSAAIAREYDAEYLPDNPGVLAAPFVAASMMSLFLYVGMRDAMRKSPDRARYDAAPGFLPFLALFLLTAPLAWLYAIPYERFMSPLGATKANLATLGLVALWRVLLLVRVVSLYTGHGFRRCLCGVMVLADVTLIFGSQVGILATMGGVRAGERERLVGDVTSAVFVAGLLTLPVWIAGARFWRLSSDVPPGPALDKSKLPPAAWPSATLAGVAIASLGVWALVLPRTQAEQRLARDVDALVDRNRYREAIALMSRHVRRDFPPLWDPRPRIFWSDEPLALLEIAHEPGTPEWIREIYVAKLGERDNGVALARAFTAYEGQEKAAARLRRILEKLPSGEPWDEMRSVLRQAKVATTTSSPPPATGAAATRPAR